MLVTLTQSMLRALFKALDFVEEVRAVWLRMKGDTVAPPPWQAAPGPEAPAAPQESRPKDPPPPAAHPEPSSRAKTMRMRAVKPPPEKPVVSKGEPKKAPAKPKPAASRKSTPPTRQPITGSTPPPVGGPAFETLLAAVGTERVATLTEELAIEGKTMPARVVWALAAAQGVLGRGLTGPQMSELLGKAGIPTAPNNLMRTIRQDAGTLFERNPGDGRAVILTLTAEGLRQARALGVMA